MMFNWITGMQQLSTPENLQALDLISPVADALTPVLGVVSAIVGGIFGLYLIMLLIRAYYERKRYLVLRDIRFNLDYLNQHFGLPYSQKKPHRLYRKVMPLEELRKLELEYNDSIVEVENDESNGQKSKKHRK